MNAIIARVKMLVRTGRFDPVRLQEAFRRSRMEILIAASFLALLLVVLNPFELWMPEVITMVLMIASLMVFGAWVAYVWGERTVSVRSLAESAFSARVGYLFGAGILLVGITVESFSHTIDPWLVFALAVILMSKIGSLIWARALK